MKTETRKIKEHPILFNGEMVRAVLDGRKTQTRRVMKVQPPSDEYKMCQLMDSTAREDRKNIYKWHWVIVEGLNIKKSDENYFNVPYGFKGDRLWLRETFVIESDQEYIGEVEIPTDRPIKIESTFEGSKYHLIPHYRATEPEPNIVFSDQDSMDDRTRWKPSIFMPRWASRITLEITDVRAERVQDIIKKPQDIEAEGVHYDIDAKIIGPCEGDAGNLIEGFSDLWNSINAKRNDGIYSWESNPWVWVVEFKRIESGERIA